MAVPDTNTFTLQNVVDEVNPTTDDLNDCFGGSNDNYFDVEYRGSKNSLLNFRNYNGSSDLYITSVIVYGTIMEIIIIHTFNPVQLSIDNGVNWTSDLASFNGAFQYTFTGITAGTYNIKARDYKGTVSWINNPVTVSSVTDWQLPSKDALQAMYDNLHAYGYGGFTAGYYWSSSEYNSATAWMINFANGVPDWLAKFWGYRIRPMRDFTDTTGTYHLRDTGPMGGWIFYIEDLGGGNSWYCEAYPNETDYTYSNRWSNIDGTLIGTTRTFIWNVFGSASTANTTEIIAQTGHTDSAAKICADLVSYIIA
jgi:hypothetical protein